MKFRQVILLVAMIGAGCSEPPSDPVKSPINADKTDFPAPPCFNKASFPAVVEQMKQLSIHYSEQQFNETSMICYSREHAQSVEQIIEQLYGRAPSENNISMGSTSDMDELEALMQAQNIPYQRRVYLGMDVIEWENADNLAVKRIVKEQFGTDLDRSKNP